MNTDTKWPKNLVVVRHGQSELNVALDLMDRGLEDKLKGLTKVRDVDIELTDLGIRQARETGKYLGEQDFKFDACYSSPYKRAVHTAEEIIAELPYKLKIFKDNRIREKEFGVNHCLPWNEFKEKFPEYYKARKRDGKYWHRLPGGENYPDVEFRLHSFLGTLVRDLAGKNVLISTHQVPCVLLRSLFEHLGEKEVLALGDVPNCGVSIYKTDKLRHQEGRMKLIEWNKAVYDRLHSGAV